MAVFLLFFLISLNDLYKFADNNNKAYKEGERICISIKVELAKL